jgi:endonuclease-8
MSGRFPIFDTSRVVAPEPTSTTRLVLSHDKLVAPLSAMTCELGDMETYAAWRSKLGQDPLDPEADVEALWASVTKSKKAVSALLMDQSFFAGVGNIYRAEVLFVARVYPRTKGKRFLLPRP